MHHVDLATPWEEISQTMEQLVREGKISYVGSSNNFAAWDVAMAQCAASARHSLGLISEQSLYNLAVRAVEMEMIPALRSLAIGLAPYSPLHVGVLAGVLRPSPRDASRTNRHSIEAHDQLEAYEGLCRQLRAKPVDVALAWLLRNPVVSTAIVGALTIEELQADLGALSVQLDAEAVERLDQIWPGPGGSRGLEPLTFSLRRLLPTGLPAPRRRPRKPTSHQLVSAWRARVYRAGAHRGHTFQVTALAPHLVSVSSGYDLLEGMFRHYSPLAFIGFLVRGASAEWMRRAEWPLLACFRCDLLMAECRIGVR
jgi:diketogulonate reductase-like aldo/keto reductase